MDAHFSITTDAAAQLVRIILSGFFAEADVRRLVAERDSAHRTLPGRLGDQLTLVDVRGMRIQPQATVAAFASMLNNPEACSRRIAFVVGSGLTRSQLGRASGGRGRRFATVEEAEAWLLAPDEARQVA